MKTKYLKAGDSYVEEIIRDVRHVNGSYTTDKELVAVTQVMNMCGLPIRKQCSSCKYYANVEPGKTQIHYCEDAKVHWKNGVYVNGRRLCERWEMADVYKMAGAKPFGKVMTKEYIKWMLDNDEYLHKMFKLLPIGSAEWITWRREQYKVETGKDCYGELKIEN